MVERVIFNVIGWESQGCEGLGIREGRRGRRAKFLFCKFYFLWKAGEGCGQKGKIKNKILNYSIWGW
ncbi:MAG: hypothetical protein AAF591_17790, partial [Verrucomicrobiota bacterium]